MESVTPVHNLGISAPAAVLPSVSAGASDAGHAVLVVHAFNSAVKGISHCYIALKVILLLLSWFTFPLKVSQSSCSTF